LLKFGRLVGPVNDPVKQAPQVAVHH